MKKNIIIINGPNLNLLGRRQPEIYGHQSFDEFFSNLVIEYSDNANLSYYQSNHEGYLIDKIQEVGYEIDGILLNAGGYTHTSIALADCISAINSPVIEIHISNIKEREAFRHHSYIEAVAVKSIMGKGLDGYREGIEYILEL